MKSQISHMILLVIMAITLNATLGTICYNGHKETYYNLPMEKVVENAHKHGIYGQYWLREDGVKMYGHYVICAVPFDIYPYGTCGIETSLGEGIALDTGAFAQENKDQIDIATGW